MTIYLPLDGIMYSIMLMPRLLYKVSTSFMSSLSLLLLLPWRQIPNEQCMFEQIPKTGPRLTKKIIKRLISFPTQRVMKTLHSIL